MKILLFFLLFFGLSIHSLLAISGGYFVNPPFLSIDIKSGSEKSFYIEVGNNTKSFESFDLSVVDFGSLDESGGVAFLNNSLEVGNRKYALALWISLEKNIVVVAPGQKEKVKVTILNKESLSAGGHYGAILVTLQSGERINTEVVGVKQSLASLVYVQKIGGVNKSLILRGIEYKKNLWKLIDQLSIRLENNGNVHLTPRGKIEINNPLGKIVGKGIINDGSSLILPESYRVFKISMMKFNQWNWPGNYNIKISYRYDGKDDYVVTSLSTFYFGKEGISICFVILFVIVIFSLKILPYHRK